MTPRRSPVARCAAAVRGPGARVLGAWTLGAFAGVLLAGQASASRVAAAVTTGTASVETAPAEELAPRVAAVGWRELRYGATKFLLAASSRLRVDEVASDEVRARLRPPPEGDAVALSVPRVTVLEVDTDLPFGRHEQVTFWLDPATGAAIQGEKLATGGKGYRKVFRYLTDGVYVWRRGPASDAEQAAGPAAWSSARATRIRPAVAFPTEAVVTDSYALLYLSSAARLDGKDRAAVLHFISDDLPVQLDLVSGGLTYRRPRHVEVWDGGERVRTGDVLVRAVTVRGRVLGREAAGPDVDLGFMGMRGSLTMFVEVGSGVPVEIVGRVEHVGEVTVRLERVVLRQPPAGTR